MIAIEAFSEAALDKAKIAYARGNREPWVELAQTFGPIIEAFAHKRMHRKKEDAEDIRQETLMVLVEKDPQDFQTLSDAEHFACAVGHHLACRQLTKEHAAKHGGGKVPFSIQGAQKEYEDTLVDPRAFTPDAIVLADDLATTLQDRLQGRELPVYKWVKDGLNNREISEKTAIKERTVKTIRERIRGKASEVFGETSGRHGR